MRSESTRAFGQPRLTNPTLGDLRIAVFNGMSDPVCELARLPSRWAGETDRTELASGQARRRGSQFIVNPSEYLRFGEAPVLLRFKKRLRGRYTARRKYL